jgi:hypothetical protein
MGLKEIRCDDKCSIYLEQDGDHRGALVSLQVT